MIAPAWPPIADEALRNVPLFAGLSDEDLERLARQMKERRFTEGSDVTSEGAGGAGFFVIIEGNATVSVSDEERGATRPRRPFRRDRADRRGHAFRDDHRGTDLLCTA